MHARRLVDFVKGGACTASCQELGDLFHQDNPVAAVLSQKLHPVALIEPTALFVGQVYLSRVPVTGEVRVGAIERRQLASGLGRNHRPSRGFDGLLGQAPGISGCVVAKEHRIFVAELVKQLRWRAPAVIARM